MELNGLPTTTIRHQWLPMPSGQRYTRWIDHRCHWLITLITRKWPLVTRKVNSTSPQNSNDKLVKSCHLCSTTCYSTTLNLTCISDTGDLQFVYVFIHYLCHLTHYILLTGICNLQLAVQHTTETRCSSGCGSRNPKRRCGWTTSKTKTFKQWQKICSLHFKTLTLPNLQVLHWICENWHQACELLSNDDHI